MSEYLAVVEHEEELVGCLLPRPAWRGRRG